EAHGQVADDRGDDLVAQGGGGDLVADGDAPGLAYRAAQQVEHALGGAGVDADGDVGDVAPARRRRPDDRGERLDQRGGAGAEQPAAHHGDPVAPLERLDEGDAL